MNYIREAEQILYYYKDLYKSITNIDRQISRLVAKAGPTNLTAIAVEEVKVSGGGQHDETINVLFELQRLVEEKNKTRKELEKLDHMLNGLGDASGCEHYEIVLREWYIEQTPRHEIALKIGYAERNVYKIKHRAIRKFAVRMFGIDALKAI